MKSEGASYPPIEPRGCRTERWGLWELQDPSRDFLGLCTGLTLLPARQSVSCQQDLPGWGIFCQNKVMETPSLAMENPPETVPVTIAPGGSKWRQCTERTRSPAIRNKMQIRDLGMQYISDTALLIAKSAWKPQRNLPPIRSACEPTHSSLIIPLASVEIKSTSKKSPFPFQCIAAIHFSCQTDTALHAAAPFLISLGMVSSFMEISQNPCD